MELIQAVAEVTAAEDRKKTEQHACERAQRQLPELRHRLSLAHLTQGRFKAFVLRLDLIRRHVDIVPERIAFRLVRELDG